MEKNVMFSAYIDNLGKRGLGEWVDFPITTQEQKELLDRLQISSEPNEFGECFEETINCDYENFPLYDQLGEYVSIEMLNKIALLMEKLNEISPVALEQFEALCKEFTDFDECMTAAQNIIDGNINYISGVDDMTGVAMHYVEEFGIDEVENLGFYIDYEALGEALTTDYDPDPSVDDPETAGEYYCGDEDASYEEIGQAFIEDFGIDSLTNPKYFINYEQLGYDMSIDGHFVFTENGCIDMNTYQYDNDMSSDYLDNLLEEFYNQDKNAPIYEDKER